MEIVGENQVVRDHAVDDWGWPIPCQRDVEVAGQIISSNQHIAGHVSAGAHCVDKGTEILDVFFELIKILRAANDLYSPALITNWAPNTIQDRIEHNNVEWHDTLKYTTAGPIDFGPSSSAERRLEISEMWKAAFPGQPFDPY